MAPSAGEPSGSDGDVVHLPGRLLLPGGVNAHNHSFQSLLRGLGDDLDFMGWRDRVLYPFSRRLGVRGIEIDAAFAFAEMLRHGITTVVDFFYIQGGGNANAEAAELLTDVVDDRLKAVVLAHLSEHNNTPELARRTAAAAIARTPGRRAAMRVAAPRGLTPAVVI